MQITSKEQGTELMVSIKYQGCLIKGDDEIQRVKLLWGKVSDWVVGRGGGDWSERLITSIRQLERTGRESTSRPVKEDFKLLNRSMSFNYLWMAGSLANFLTNKSKKKKAWLENPPWPIFIGLLKVVLKIYFSCCWFNQRGEFCVIGSNVRKDTWTD